MVLRLDGHFFFFKALLSFCRFSFRWFNELYKAAPMEPGIKTKDLKMGLTLYRAKDLMWTFSRGIKKNAIMQ